jgi:hypothetical protein
VPWLCTLPRHSLAFGARKLFPAIACLAVLAPAAAAGQHEHHPPGHEMPGEPEPSPEPAAHEHGAMTGPLGLPEHRNASGTSWQPDSTPMYGVHFSGLGWQWMLHGLVFVGYDEQATPRGHGVVTAMGWVMLMAQHPLAGGDLGVRVMLSLDPLTVEKEGYPLLLQSGEALGGMPLHDVQHPHDLFMEVAARYTRPLTSGLALLLYAAPSGEPALGPPAFAHRLSAMSDPMAPLSHHWQDSTHVSFGVVTVGLLTSSWKLEGSWFNGREPDDDRYDFDLRALDSASGRLTWNPGPNWSIQVSIGYLDSPEELEPATSLERVTASALYNRRTGEGNWAATAVWGRNVPSPGPTTDSLLLESNWNLDGANVLFGRGEIVTKTGLDLGLPVPNQQDTFTVGSLVLGYERYLGTGLAGVVPGLGARGALNLVGDSLRPLYGTRVPLGLMIFLQLRPAEMAMHH